MEIKKLNWKKEHKWVYTEEEENSWNPLFTTVTMKELYWIKPETLLDLFIPIIGILIIFPLYLLLDLLFLPFNFMSAIKLRGKR